MSDRVWFITGASRGIGADIARAVLSCGDKLVATARHAASLAQLGVSDDLLSVSLDVTDEEQSAGASLRRSIVSERSTSSSTTPVSVCSVR